MSGRSGEGTFVGHYPCPDPNCGSSDGLAVYEKEDGTFDGTCFAHPGGKKWFLLDEGFNVVQPTYAPQQGYMPDSVETALQYGHTMIAERGIEQSVVELYGVRVKINPTTAAAEAHYYPVNVNGQLQGFKKRILPKTFVAIGNTKNSDFFGQSLHANARGGSLIITEGEIDCMSAFQMTKQNATNGKGWRVVSLPNGADAVAAVKKHLEWLEAFNKVILCLDNDDVGREATRNISELLSPGKAHICMWPSNMTQLGIKDANDALMKGQASSFIQMLYDAAPHTPAGIVSGKDTWEILQNRPSVVSVAYPMNWKLNELTYGIRLGELDTFTSGSGSGKTALLREIQFHLLNVTDSSVGIIALEEPLADTVHALMSLYLNKRIHLPDTKYTTEEYLAAWKYVAEPNRIHMYDHWGSTDADTLYNKIRYMAKGLGCKYVFLDHLSIVVSEFSAEGDERRQIDTIMSKLKNLTQELNIWIGLVVHLRKTSSGTSFEEGAVPTTDDLRGSGAIKQLSNGVIAIARNQQHKDDYMRNTSSVHVLKNRFSGRTGAAGWLHFDGKTGRMIPVDDPMLELAKREEAQQADALNQAASSGLV